jgi:hypothetical protein
VVVFFNGHKIFKEQSDLSVVMVFNATLNNISVISWRSIRFEKIFLMVFTIKEKIREKMPKIHWFKQITVYSNLPCQENYCLLQFTVSITLPFVAINRVNQTTVYSNLPCQSNYRWQQFIVSSKLPFTAIYCVKQFTVYSNLPCQANYRLQQFTVSSKLQFTAIYCVKQITVYSNLPFTALYCVKQIPYTAI